MIRSFCLCSLSHVVLIKTPIAGIIIPFCRRETEAQTEYVSLPKVTQTVSDTAWNWRHMFCSKSMFLTNVNSVSLSRLTPPQGRTDRAGAWYSEASTCHFYHSTGNPNAIVTGNSKRPMLGEERNETKQWSGYYKSIQILQEQLIWRCRVTNDILNNVLSQSLASHPLTPRKRGPFCTWRTIRDHLSLMVHHVSTLGNCG